MRLFFARHGQTEWNLAGRHQGQRDSPLTAAGERQARLLAARLAPERLDAGRAGKRVLERRGPPRRARGLSHPAARPA